MNDAKFSVVLFIPEAGVYPYLRGLSVLGDAIARSGGEVFITKCSGQMKRCIMMDMNNLPINITAEEKCKLCKVCSSNLSNAQLKYGFKTIDLSEFVDDGLTMEIDVLTLGVAKKDKENISFKGFPVGKAAQFDFTLATKYLYNLDLSEEHQLIYDTYIKNIALVTAIAERICKQYQPSLLLTFGEYAEYQGARHATILEKVSRMAMIYPMHYNADCSRFIIWQGTNESFFYPHCQRWIQGKDIPISPKNVMECWNDTMYRLFVAGSHIFSPKKEKDPSFIFEKLALHPKKKTIVVYTSSYDERYVKNVVMEVWKEGPDILDAFPNQIEWLSFLQNYVVGRDDIQIVVRIHPREGSRQYGFDSQHLKSLKEKFAEKTENFIVIWPDDSTSSYDLMELADVCLVPWSLMGQEAARLGIPVLSCTGNMFYPDDDFIQVATNPEEYKNKLDSIINMEYTWNHLLKAVRFYYWRTFVPSLDLGETVPKDFDDHSIWPEAPESMVGVINDILSGKQDLIEYNIKKWKESLPEDATAQETLAMKQGIRRFLDKIFYPPAAPGRSSSMIKAVNYIWRIIAKKNLYNPSKLKGDVFCDYQLRYSENVEQLNDFVEETRRDSKLRVLVADGLYAILIHKGNVLRRMSPVIAKLAKLHENAR